MSVTSRDISVILAVATYYVLSRQQVQRLCFPEDRSGRITRRRLQTLVSAHFVSRHRLFPSHPGSGAPAPVYYPARRGCEFLAEHFDDERFLATNTECPQAHLLHHWLDISETHFTLDAALALQKEMKLQDEVKLEAWYNEWEVVNKNESAPERRFRIYTLIQENPRLVCAPDGAFLLSKDGYRKVFLLEQDRNSSGVQRIAAQRTPGYATMAERNLHLRLFPGANVPGFSVLMIAPTPQRRNALRKAIREKPGAPLWKFVAASDLTAETFLYEPIFHPCEGDPVPLIKRDVPVIAPGTVTKTSPTSS